MKKNIICFGEIVWDALPRTLYLGGAPLNVASHLARFDIPVQMVSRIGNDALGEEVIRNMDYAGLDASLIQKDNQLPTGLVRVEMDEEEPSYEIIAPSSWDEIEYTPELQSHADEAFALVFGTLSQRNDTTRQTLEKLWDAPCLKVLDVNLRPPFVDKEHVAASLKAADIVKLNEDEFNQIRKWFGFEDETEPAIREIAFRFHCESICLTRGANGSMLLHKGELIHQPGIPVEAVDTIGAGDSFLAALLAGIREGKGGKQIMEHAAKLAAFVATKSGAVPDYSPEDFLTPDDLMS